MGQKNLHSADQIETDTDHHGHACSFFDGPAPFSTGKWWLLAPCDASRYGPWVLCDVCLPRHGWLVPWPCKEHSTVVRRATAPARRECRWVRRCDRDACLPKFIVVGHRQQSHRCWAVTVRGARWPGGSRHLCRGGWRGDAYAFPRQIRALILSRATCVMATRPIPSSLRVSRPPRSSGITPAIGLAIAHLRGGLYSASLT